jgi:hypothetical protein
MVKMIEEFDQKGNIKNFDIDEDLEVETWWDLGMNDSTVITFVQRHNNEIRIIDCYENSGEGLEHYLNVIDNKDYTLFKAHSSP